MAQLAATLRKARRALSSLALIAGAAIAGYFARDAAPLVREKAVEAYEWLTDDQAGKAIRQKKELTAKMEDTPQEAERRGLESLGAFTLTPKERRQLTEELYTWEGKRRAFLESLNHIPANEHLTARLCDLNLDTITLTSKEILRGITVANTDTRPYTCALRILELTESEKDSDVRRKADTDMLSLYIANADELLALYLWRLVRDNHYFSFARGAKPDLFNPGLNSLIRKFGYGLCGDASSAFVILANHSGLEARLVGLSAKEGQHQVAEVRYKGEWHMFDPTCGLIFLEELGKGLYKIASMDDVQHNPNIITDTLGKDRDLPVLGQTAKGNAEHITRFYSAASLKYKYYHTIVEAECEQVYPFLNVGDILSSRYSTTGRSAWSIPLVIDYTLAAGESITFTNIPYAEPYTPDNKRDNRPPFWANGSCEKRLEFTQATSQQIVMSPSVVTDITLDREGYQVSFNGKDWVNPDNKVALREQLNYCPREYYLIRGPKGEIAAHTTFQCSPFVLGRTGDEERGRVFCISQKDRRDKTHITLTVERTTPTTTRYAPRNDEQAGAVP